MLRKGGVKDSHNQQRDFSTDMPLVTITSAEFRNFKALSHYSVRFQSLSILVGPNNSGKSTVLSAFRVLAAGLKRARSKAPEYVQGPKVTVTGGRCPVKPYPSRLKIFTRIC